MLGKSQAIEDIEPHLCPRVPDEGDDGRGALVTKGAIGNIERCIIHAERRAVALVLQIATPIPLCSQRGERGDDMRRRRRHVLSGLDSGAHLSKGCVTTNACDTCAGSGLRRCSRRHRKPDRDAENRGDPQQLHLEANLATDQGTLILMPVRASRASSISQPPFRYRVE